MNITAIFVELLIIGLGVLCWLTLIIAYFLELKINSSLFNINPIFIAPLVAIAYIFGIVADRLIRDPFIFFIENPSKRFVHKEYKAKIENLKNMSISVNEPLKPMELEKFVRANSAELGQKIDYNRNRLRICRAWILHFLLITIGLAVWNSKVAVFNSTQQLWIIVTGFILFGFTLYTSIKLSIDHQRDIIESSEIILMNKKQAIQVSCPTK
jgi:hypothetical protein